ncbi:KIN17-like protein [Escovopsis weberi]|uniref:KIN17-like protein n=1 Tax=Escovopsis weberi TaxID=150374 RepID=A0A0M8N392_ESCWE|nr:KIN17-like protein [Escovopsis weberi]
MPKAEVGSTKWLSNKMRAKGLQRLRWYCQVCEKQCLDANGFKMHTQSEGHVRQMLLVGEDAKKYINDFSSMFLKDFLQLLKTGHGEKQVHINHFYQEYIANKQHIHMNATKWPSLTEFAKHLGREGICRVEETEKGIHISWIDDSPEALRRQEALRKKAAQDQGDEESEQRMIREQIKRAQQSASKRSGAGADDAEEEDSEDKELKRQDGEKIKLSFGAKPKQDAPTTTAAAAESGGGAEGLTSTGDQKAEADTKDAQPETEKPPTKPSGFGGGGGGLSLKLGAPKPQTKNVFAQAKKNALASGSKKSAMVQPAKKMSEAERIMKEEMERKRSRESAGFGMPSSKKQRS